MFGNPSRTASSLSYVAEHESFTPLLLFGLASVTTEAHVSLKFLYCEPRSPCDYLETAFMEGIGDGRSQGRVLIHRMS